MGKHLDLTDFLKEWDYHEGKNVRFFTTLDGREIMQVRLPLGVEQYEMEGRPDGFKPHGYDSWLDYELDKLNDSQLEDREYVMDQEAYFNLREEGILYYSRYLVLFQAGKYEPVIDDTAHNLEIARLVSDCYVPEEKADLLQYLPYIRRVNAVAHAMLCLNRGDREQAKTELERGIRDVNEYDGHDSPIFTVEKLRSLQNLEQLLDQVGNDSDSEKEVLEEELKRAVESENYEQAARIRDRLKDIDPRG